MDVTKKRDSSKPANEQGVFHKFDVRRTDGSDKPGGKHHGCRYFVLDLDHDPHAAAAMAAYAQDCKATHPALSAELSAEYPAHAVDASTIDRAWARFYSALGDPRREFEIEDVVSAVRAVVASIPAPPEEEDNDPTSGD